MTEIRHFCDKCGERITEDRTLFLVKCGPERSKRPEIELCSTCLSSVVALIDDRTAGCTAPTPRASAANRAAAMLSAPSCWRT